MNKGGSLQAWCLHTGTGAKVPVPARGRHTNKNIMDTWKESLEQLHIAMEMSEEIFEEELAEIKV